MIPFIRVQRPYATDGPGLQFIQAGSPLVVIAGSGNDVLLRAIREHAENPSLEGLVSFSGEHDGYAVRTMPLSNGVAEVVARRFGSAEETSYSVQGWFKHVGGCEPGTVYCWESPVELLRTRSQRPVIRALKIHMYAENRRPRYRAAQQFFIATDDERIIYTPGARFVDASGVRPSELITRDFSA